MSVNVGGVNELKKKKKTWIHLLKVFNLPLIMVPYHAGDCTEKEISQSCRNDVGRLFRVCVSVCRGAKRASYV